MSLLIDMEKPLSCEGCRFCEYEQGHCTALPVGEWRQITDMSECPLQEQKTGKWMVVKEGINTYRVKCSNCGIVLHTGYGFDSKESYMQLIRDACDKYCHDCGAKMEVDE